MLSPNAFFVYGTLKRRQANFPLIAQYARAIEPASTRGRLLDFGLFPGMLDTDGTVRGEYFRVAPADLAVVLAILDPLEGYQPSDPGGSIYLRRVVTVHLATGERHDAFAYFYNRDPTGLPLLAAEEWSGPSATMPPFTDELAAFREHVRGYRRRVARSER